jgi:mannose-1-phosphate guanylyltransferase/mannose-6-phosphate isomerase
LGELRGTRHETLFTTPIVIACPTFDLLLRSGREVDIVLEPVRRDSAPAIAVATEIPASLGIAAALAADYVITNREGFCREATPAAASYNTGCCAMQH